jgi:MFS family permease
MNLFNHKQKHTRDRESVFKWSIATLRLAVFTETVVGYMLMPNFAIMADIGRHDESFTSTAPFDFSSATYFMPMMHLIGVAIASTFTGTISDKVGRKPVILVCITGSMIGCAVKWVCRKSFWAFCISNLVFGLLAGGFPVALAYVSDSFEAKAAKAKQFGLIIVFWVMGQSAGGIISVLMYPLGLFAPLWAGVAVMFITFCFTYYFLVEPSDLKLVPTHDEEEDENHTTDKIENEDQGKEIEVKNNPSLPDTIDYKTMCIILLGTFSDVIGSKALFPLCLAPLAYEVYYKDFVDNGEAPVLSINGYQLLTVFVVLAVVPSAILTPRAFQKIGLASTCVLGNIVTGIVTIALLLIANIEKATTLTLIAFAIVLYVGFPFTVTSQLSTSPMLDRISPVHSRGFVQGLYTTFFNLAAAIAPWLLGLLADLTSTNTMIWTGVGISFGAGLINSPLMLQRRFGPEKKEVDSPAINDLDDEEEEGHHDQ